MAFVSIGSLAAKVLTKAARTAERRARELVASHPGEEPDSSPVSRTPAAQALSSREGVGASAIGEGKTAGSAGELARPQLEALSSVKLSDRCEPTHVPSAFPPRRVGSHLLLDAPKLHVSAPST